MSDISELLITTSKTSLEIWDGLNSTTINNVKSIKVNGFIERSSLNILGNDYVMIAEHKKPLLHVWEIGSNDPSTRIVLPEPADVVTVSPDNCYIAIGMKKKLYIWQLSSGALLYVQEVHLHSITCIQFSSNTDNLIIGDKNGGVSVYNFSDLINFQELTLVQKDNSMQVKSLYNLSDHLTSITDIYVGSFGLKSRFATSSLDNTCCIYELLTGKLLLQLSHIKEISAMIIDSSFCNLYLGTTSGALQQIQLTDPPRTRTHHVDNSDSSLIFIGHTACVNCVALNATNKILVSGGEDKLVIIWEIASRHMLNRLEHKSPITNLCFIFSNIFNKHKLKIAFSELQRNITVTSENFKNTVIQDEDIVFSDDSSSDSDD